MDRLTLPQRRELERTAYDPTLPAQQQNAARTTLHQDDCAVFGDLDARVAALTEATLLPTRGPLLVMQESRMAALEAGVAAVASYLLELHTIVREGATEPPRLVGGDDVPDSGETPAEVVAAAAAAFAPTAANA